MDSFYAFLVMLLPVIVIISLNVRIFVQILRHRCTIVNETVKDTILRGNTPINQCYSGKASSSSTSTSSHRCNAIYCGSRLSGDYRASGSANDGADLKHLKRKSFCAMKLNYTDGQPPNSTQAYTNINCRRKTSHRLDRLGRQFVLILLGISSCFLLLNMPYLMTWIYRWYKLQTKIYEENNESKFYDSMPRTILTPWDEVALPIARSLFTLNYCINIFIYSLSGKYFRRELVRLFWNWKYALYSQFCPTRARHLIIRRREIDSKHRIVRLRLCHQNNIMHCHGPQGLFAVHTRPILRCHYESLNQQVVQIFNSSENRCLALK